MSVTSFRHRLERGLAAFIAPTAAPPPRSGPRTVTKPVPVPAGDLTEAEFTAAASGAVVGVWRRSNQALSRIETQVRPGGGRILPLQVLSRPGTSAFAPRVAVGPDGQAAFTWLRADGDHANVEGRVRAPTGELGPVLRLSRPGTDAREPRVCIGAEGTVFFAWQRFDGTNWRVEGKRRDPGGELSVVQALSVAGGDARDPDVAVDALGRALFVWRRDDGSGDRIQARSLGADGLTPVRSLSGPGQPAHDPRVAIGPDGDALVVWRRSTEAGSRIEARARAADGGLGGVLMVSGRHDAVDPRVVAAEDGSFLIAWRHFDGTSWRVRARHLDADGVLGVMQTLSGSGGDATDLQLCAGPDGDAAIAWRRFDGANWRVQLRMRSASGALGSTQTASPAGVDVAGPCVAFCPDGHGLLAWRRSDGPLQRIETRGRDAAGQLSGAAPIVESGLARV